MSDKDRHMMQDSTKQRLPSDGISQPTNNSFQKADGVY